MKARDACVRVELMVGFGTLIVPLLLDHEGVKLESPFHPLHSRRYRETRWKCQRVLDCARQYYHLQRSCGRLT